MLFFFLQFSQNAQVFITYCGPGFQFNRTSGFCVCRTDLKLLLRCSKSRVFVEVITNREGSLRSNHKSQAFVQLSTWQCLREETHDVMYFDETFTLGCISGVERLERTGQSKPECFAGLQRFCCSWRIQYAGWSLFQFGVLSEHHHTTKFVRVHYEEGCGAFLQAPKAKGRLPYFPETKYPSNISTQCCCLVSPEGKHPRI